jgi:FAD synthetase
VSLKSLTTKYIESAEKVLKDLEQTKVAITVPEADVVKVLNWASDYLEDAKYYKAQGKLETSLTSVAYCEGLLDALRLLRGVKFEWPTVKERKKLS